MDNKLVKDNIVFGLDIGTRSVVGIVGYKSIGGFTVIGDYVEMHDTRSMIDGQIHDVERVAQTIKKVKRELENQIGFSLKEVSIAAAGRVLKTCKVGVEQTVDTNELIDSDRIYALELLGIEKAHQQIQSTVGDLDSGFHCVGYTVSNYFLNGYEIKNLKGHKGKKIGAEVLATFLPKEVVESLYQVIDRANLQVKNLTLEPIAAIEVAIPPNYRLLNIALVDIGAGTSDIAITKDGSIIAYGMIPVAGDEITESIVHQYLVDFKTAEKIKIKSSGRAKNISFKDIMGLKHQVQLEDVRNSITDSMMSLATSIGDKIKELNGGQPTNAVFVVGGGGQLKGFDDALAKVLNINKERVAIRGKEVLGMVNFESGAKKGPELVTPIGICYSATDAGKYDFIQVFFNDEPVKVFNSNSITVMDIAAFKGYDPRRLLVTRGEDLIFSFNGHSKVIKGKPGEPPVIMINNEPAHMNDQVKMNDYITILDSKKGEAGAITTNQLKKELTPISISINNEPYEVLPSLRLNNEPVMINYDIAQNDQVTIEAPTIKEVFVKHSIPYNGTDIYVNGPKKSLEDVVCDNDIILFDAYISKKEESSVRESSTEDKKDSLSDTTTISVLVNGQWVQLSGKSSYIFVDIFDFYDFNRTKVQGTLICTINNKKIGYMEPVKDKDVIEIFWKKSEA